MLTEKARIHLFVIIPLVIPVIAIGTMFPGIDNKMHFEFWVKMFFGSLIGVSIVYFLVNRFLVNRIRVYIKIIMCLAVMAVIPNMLLLGIALLAIPGLLMILSVNVLFYSVFIMYLLFDFKNKNTKYIVTSASLLLAVTISVAPYLISSFRLEEIAEGLRKDDFDYFVPMHIKKIILASNDHGWRGGWKQPAVVCNETCQRLLYNNEVDVVYMVYLPDDKSQAEQQRQVSYHIERRDACPAYYSKLEASPFGQSVKTNISHGLCLVAEEIKEKVSADVTIEEFEDRYIDQNKSTYNRLQQSKDSLEPRVIKAKSVCVYTDLQSLERNKVYKSTSVSGEIVGWPLVFSCGEPKQLLLVMELWRKRITFNESTIDSILKDKLGFKLDAISIATQ